MGSSEHIEGGDASDSPQNSSFHSTLKVGRSKSVSLALLKDELMAVEASTPNTSPLHSPILCGCIPNPLSLSHQAPAFTSIPYYHILSVQVNGPSLKISYATPTHQQRAYRERNKPSFLFPVSVATTEFTIHQNEAESQTLQWAEELRSRAYGKAPQKRRIFVILNPFGGKGNALSIWERIIKPLLAAALCIFELRLTEYSGHATEIVRDLDLNDWDVIACCSGDGVVSEVFNGLADRPSPISSLSRVSVFQLPCGSGNAMSFNLTGTVDPSAATIALLKGSSIPMDLMSMTQDGKRTVSFLSQSVGMIADCDVGTDHLRWMGPARFTLGIVWRILRQTIYPCDVAFPSSMIDDKSQIRQEYLSLVPDSSSPAVEQQSAVTAPNQNLIPQTLDIDDKSMSSFQRSHSASVTSRLLSDVEPLTGSSVLAALAAEPAVSELFDSGADNGDNIGTTSSSAFGDALSSAPANELPILKYGTVQDPLPADWTVVEGPNLGTLIAGNMAFMADDAHFFPTSKPSDGMMDLVIISGRNGRYSGLSAVTCIDNGPKFFDLPMVKYFKTDAFRVIPRSRPSTAEGRDLEANASGLISIDGEGGIFTPFQVEVHRGLGRVISMYGTERYAPGVPWN